jgi:DnaJ-class molecular chaperone
MHEGPEPEFIDEEHGITDAVSPFQINCNFCNGTGVHPGSMESLAHTRCPVCHGTGILHFHDGRENFHTCHRCQGTGREPGQSPPERCATCNGYGLVESR